MPVAAVPVVVALVMFVFSILVVVTSFVLILGARPDCHGCNKRGTQEKHSQETQDTMHVVALLGTLIGPGFHSGALPSETSSAFSDSTTGTKQTLHFNRRMLTKSLS